MKTTPFVITRHEAGPAWPYLVDAVVYLHGTTPWNFINGTRRRARLVIADAIARWDNARAELDSAGGGLDDCDVESIAILKRLYTEAK
jgi:hypothetical protein